MKKYLLLFCLLPLSVFAQDKPEYKVEFVPKELLKNADVVVRLQDEAFIVENEGKATQKGKLVYTILNKEADKYSVYGRNYDKLTEIDVLSGKLYNKNGKLIKKLKKSDAVDFNISDMNEIFDDRVKGLSFDYNEYPYTVEFEYEIKIKQLFFYPEFEPKQLSNAAVQHCIFSLTVPSNNQFYYKTYNTSIQPEIKEIKSRKSYTWQFRDLPTINQEVLSPSINDMVAHISTSPNKFELEKYEGKMDTWDNLGAFVYQLNEGRQELPKKTKIKLQEMVANAKDDYEKVQIIYNYMQSKTRYIAIILGIGSWQPLPAELVDTKGYGECKALSNYTKSLLNEVGVKSHYVLVKAGEYNRGDIKSDFPTSRFNHAMLCVPTQKDTIWLECTNQKMPTGFLGDFTDDRYVLLITENGGKLAKTPKYTMQDNQLIRKAEVTIKETGEAKSNIQTQYTGIEYGNIMWFIYASPENQKNYLNKTTNIVDFEMVSIDTKNDKSPKPKLELNMSIKTNQIGAKNGKRIFFTPNLFNKFSLPLVDYKERKTDIELPFRDFEHNDELRFTIPSNFQLEGNFESVNLTSTFGTYSISLIKENNVLVYKRKLQVKSGRYPKEKYQEFLDFFRKVDKYDKMKAVLVSQ